MAAILAGRLISGTTSSNWKNILMMLSPFIEEGYKLYNTTQLR